MWHLWHNHTQSARGRKTKTIITGMSIERFWNANIIIFLHFVSFSFSFCLMHTVCTTAFYGPKSQNVWFLLFCTMWWDDWILGIFSKKNLNKKTAFKYDVSKRLYSNTFLIGPNAYRSIFVYFLIFPGFHLSPCLAYEHECFSAFADILYSITW